MPESYTVGDLIYEGAIYDGMNTSLDDLAFYKRWLPKNKQAQILELCCGTGRLTLPIAKAGYEITGVDFTASMLAQAKQKAAAAELSITFVEADIRNAVLPQQYDFIFMPFNSIHHLYTNQDLFQALETVKKHLKDKGLFVFDCFNPNIRFMAEGEKELKEIAAYTAEDGREVVIKEIMHYHSKTQVNRIEWHYFINGTFHSVQKLDMRMYYPLELDAYLEQLGFRSLHKFGGFQEEPFTDESEKQLFICDIPS